MKLPALSTHVLALAAALFPLAGCRSVPPPTPLNQLNAEQRRGHGVYEARCAVCHYDRRDGPLHGPALLSVFKKPALPSGAAATDERVTATITNGRNMMPPFNEQHGNQLDPADLDDLLAYLHTL